jgi:prepilin-type N-terminal cleavage/methylation domain-containing protein
MRQRGFTIVELLIVIVIIGVLAALVIIAYNGIQTRAQNTQTVQAVSQYVKIFTSYAASYGLYPVETAYPCLAESGQTCARVSGTTNCFGIGVTGSNASIVTEMKKIVTNLPKTSSQRISCNGAQYSGAFISPTSNGTALTINYFLKGDQLCGGIGGVVGYSKNQQDDLTRCTATLPTLP